MKKIMITGCPASGKSTLGNNLSKILGIPLFHLDQLFWIRSGGIKQDAFIAQQESIVKDNGTWIIDGDFVRSRSFELRVLNSDMIIMYEFPRHLVYWRLFKRLVRDYGRNRPDMPEGRRKTLKATWHVAKYIWSYDNRLAWEKISQAGAKGKVVVVRSPEDEKKVLRLAGEAL